MADCVLTETYKMAHRKDGAEKRWLGRVSRVYDCETDNVRENAYSNPVL